MGKDGERAYLRNIGKDGQKHAFNKPYSDDNCGRYLMDIGLIISLLPPPPGKLIDLGAGTGWTSVFFAQRGYEVTGQDIAEDMIALAEANKTRYNIESLKFITCDYESLPFNQEFEYAVFYDSLHHSVDVDESMKAVYRVLKPGGICITAEPGIFHSRRVISKMAMAKWGVTERDMPPSRIIRAGKKAGFSKAKVYLRLNNCPFEILPYLSPTGFLRAGKTFLRFLPGLGNLTTNITMMVKG